MWQSKFGDGKKDLIRDFAVIPQLYGRCLWLVLESGVALVLLSLPLWDTMIT